MGTSTETTTRNDTSLSKMNRGFTTRRYGYRDQHHPQPTGGINISGHERLASIAAALLLALIGVRVRKLPGIALMLVGGELLRRGLTGHCYLYEALGVNRAQVSKDAAVSVPHGQGIRVECSITVNRAIEEVYRFWRNFENLPQFMSHLESVEMLGGNRSHWVAKAPAGITVEWDAEIISEVENERIGWRSLEDADVSSAGSVQFHRAPGGRGTEVRVVLEYVPPAGVLGAAIAKLFGEEPQQQINNDLRHFKQIMEAGEIPTREGQPSGRSKDAVERPQAVRLSSAHKDIVQKASEESFPASDPPGWTARREG